MKKRSFLLLEILIAFFLLVICALPLVKTPIAIFSKQMENIKKIERQRLSDLVFYELYSEWLTKKSLPYKDILENKFFDWTLLSPKKNFHSSYYVKSPEIFYKMSIHRKKLDPTTKTPSSLLVRIDVSLSKVRGKSKITGTYYVLAIKDGSFEILPSQTLQKLAVLPNRVTPNF